MKIFNFPADSEVSLVTAGVKKHSFFVNPEDSVVGRNLLPFFPKRERKHRMKETYLTTPLRENQLHQCGNPAVAVVSASQPSSTSKTSELYVSGLVIG